MQYIQLVYQTFGMFDSAVKILSVVPDSPTTLPPDGMLGLPVYTRRELDDLFAGHGWHLVSDTNGVLTYAGSLRPMPIATA